MSETTFAVTRVVNACVLLQFGDDYVLTDPYFRELTRLVPRMREPFGLSVRDLPGLAAITGGHSAFDHWHLASLDAYPFKDTTPVFAPSPVAAKRARSAGFSNVEHLTWNETRRISENLTLEAAPAQESGGSLANNYVISTPQIRVFVGTEACEMDPIRKYSETHAPVDVALLPIDSSNLFRHKLVMNAQEALTAARTLGAKVLVPIHYSLKPAPFVFQTPCSEKDLQRLAPTVPDIDIRCLPTGVRWQYQSGLPGPKSLREQERPSQVGA
jgi:L-ascorbate metabolism protein UlaG (beta-lactamase superfamily)